MQEYVGSSPALNQVFILAKVEESPKGHLISFFTAVRLPNFFGSLLSIFGKRKRFASIEGLLSFRHYSTYRILFSNFFLRSLDFLRG